MTADPRPLLMIKFPLAGALGIILLDQGELLYSVPFLLLSLFFAWWLRGGCIRFEERSQEKPTQRALDEYADAGEGGNE